MKLLLLLLLLLLLVIDPEWFYVECRTHLLDNRDREDPFNPCEQEQHHKQDKVRVQDRPGHGVVKDSVQGSEERDDHRGLDLPDGLSADALRDEALRHVRGPHRHGEGVPVWVQLDVQRALQHPQEGEGDERDVQHSLLQRLHEGRAPVGVPPLRDAPVDAVHVLPDGPKRRDTEDDLEDSGDGDVLVPEGDHREDAWAENGTEEVQRDLVEVELCGPCELPHDEDAFVVLFPVREPVGGDPDDGGDDGRDSATVEHTAHHHRGEAHHDGVDPVVKKLPQWRGGAGLPRLLSVNSVEGL